MTAKRPEYRLGVGGDYLPADADDANFKAIRLFLEAVDRLVPECWKALATIAADVPDRLPSQFVRDVNPDAPLREWARTWGFTSPKLVRLARGTAGRIRRLPRLRAAWAITGSYWPPDFPPFVNPLWDPIEESERSFRARVEDYVREIKATPGIVPAPKKRSGERPFDWLALHQVGGWTLERIATKYQDRNGHPTESGISRAVSEAAALVGLTLRSGQGRPRKVAAGKES